MLLCALFSLNFIDIIEDIILGYTTREKKSLYFTERETIKEKNKRAEKSFVTLRERRL